LRERVVLVVVALGALQRGPQPDHAERVDPIVYLIDARLLGVAASLDVRRSRTVEAGRDPLRLGGAGQKIAG